MKAVAARRLFGVSLIALMVLGNSASAQEAGAAPSAADQTDAVPTQAGVGDIIVTAQRRSESLQRTSIVLDVISAESIERAGITQAQQLTTLNPGVQIGLAGPTLQVYIRGVGDFGATANFSPSVAFNIDGVYVSRTQSIPSEFYDVERVEALKGPQGTLYGRNASGGALNLLTRKPQLGDFSGRFAVDGGSFHSVSVDGAVNIPLGPTLAARVSGIYVRKDGYTSQKYGDDKHQSARLKLLWEPSSDVSLLLNGSYGHIGGKGSAFVLVNKVPGLTTQYPWTDITDPSIVPFLVAGKASALPPIPGLIVNPKPNDGFQDMTFWNVSAQLDADLGFAKLTVLPAYRHSKMRYTSVNLVKYQLGKAFGIYPETPETSKQTSVEVRLANESPSLKWVLGGYFYNEDQYSQFLTFQGLIANSAAAYTVGTRSYAAFGQATYSVVDKVRVIGGLRYTADRRSLAGAKFNVAPTLACPFAPGTVCPVESFTGRKTFKNLSWKAGVEADLGPQNLFFATVSSGFKSGGFNTQIAPDASPGSTAAYLFRPEKLIAYEVGVKNRFLDNRLQVNLEGFYWDYKDHQEPLIAVSGAGNTGLATINAGKARLYGGSVDVVAKPLENTTVNAAVEYNNSKYTEFTIIQPARFVFNGSTGCNVTLPAVPPGPSGPVAALNCKGFELNRAPKWAGSAGITQVIPLGGASTLEANGTLQYASARWITADFVSASRAPHYTTLNASLTYISENDTLTLTAYVRNITNAVNYQGGLQAPFQPGILTASIAPPRNYGVRMAIRF